MIFNAFRQLRERGVLGINRRNAAYVMQCNARHRYPLVDDKIVTKRLAEKHHIPTPALYHIVEHHGDIAGLKEALGALQSFVMKPARGVGGSGIVLVTDRTEDGFVSQDGELISWVDLRYHVSDILSGIYSLSGLEDRVIFEELIRPDPVFASVSFEGVPDIRIVAYRGVPAMAMVRLPTKASDGKANLHRGAIGAGVEISSGRTLTAVHHTEVITHHPDTGHPVSGIQVPHWARMLLIAATASDMTGLCYLGVDLVIDRRQGPLLLEMNARPGLSIQLANFSGLRKRLESIDKTPPDLFTTPERRVAWATRTFRKDGD